MVELLEIFFDIAGEKIIGNYLKLMSSLFPNMKTKKPFYIFFGILFLVFLSGIICLFLEGALPRVFGILAVSLSLGIVILNLILGLILKRIANKNNK
jgi:hypothetical protein